MSGKNMQELKNFGNGGEAFVKFYLASPSKKYVFTLKCTLTQIPRPGATTD